jgi:predicted dehydrogenase
MRRKATIMNKIFGIILLGFAINALQAGQPTPPIRLAVIGLDHDAVGDFIARMRTHSDVQLVGIVESNQTLVARYTQLLSLSTNSFAASLEELLARTNVQAAAVFTSTLDHRQVVEDCAAHKIDVMLEKPLAINLDAALAMASTAKKNGIQIIVDYETSWYPSIRTAYEIVHSRQEIGELRHLEVNAGDVGPKEAGCSDMFVEWLTDPKQSGGGAVTDFGCYGAALITWFMNEQRPDSVFALAQHTKPQLYPNVEDAGTIVVSYPQTQGSIQTSWNLPFAERSMKIYGTTGYVFVPQSDLLRLRLDGTAESDLQLQSQPEPNLSPDDISYFAAVVRGDVQPAGPSSLQVNLVAAEIIDAAKKSIQLGKQIDLPKDSPW